MAGYAYIYIASLFAFTFLQRYALGCDWLVPRVILLRWRWKRSQCPSQASKYSSLVYNPSVSLVAPQFRCRCCRLLHKGYNFFTQCSFGLYVCHFCSLPFIQFQWSPFSPFRIIAKARRKEHIPYFLFTFICDLVLNSLYNDPLSVA
jgi:hypothetical protein